jgi:hypothetical protein
MGRGSGEQVCFWYYYDKMCASLSTMCSVGTCPTFQVSMSMMHRIFSLNSCSDHECSGKIPCLFNEHTENFERIIMIFWVCLFDFCTIGDLLKPFCFLPFHFLYE